MDRRSFLSRLGIGAAATVTTQLWLPPVSTAVAQPERRVFVPPRGGWPADGWGVPVENVANWRSLELNKVTRILWQGKEPTRYRYLRLVIGPEQQVRLERSVTSEPNEWEPAPDIVDARITYGFDARPWESGVSAALTYA